MSTRGCVAIGSPSRWRGVYNHWDSYPTCLGQEVWLHLSSITADGKTLDDFSRELLAHDDWRSYLNRGICEYCGKKTTQPHSISGAIFARDEKFKTKADMRRYFRSLPAWNGRDADIEKMIDAEWRVRENIARTGYPDPDAKHHQHDTRPVEEQHLTSENPDPLFIEWVYVIEPETATLHVLSHNGHATPEPEGPDGKPCRKGGEGACDYGHCVYWHELVASLPLNGAEPDWDDVESKAR